MSAKPIVILAFSNGYTNPLPYLQEEAYQLSNMFLELQDKGLIELRYYPQMKMELLSRDLRDLRKRRIALFHYGGHADQDNVELNSDPFFLEEIVPLMVKNWKPKMVFLNGCSTGGMAEMMCKAGIQTVIGTEKPVCDREAMDFSLNFYKSLIKDWTVKDSFDHASSMFRASGRRTQYFRNPDARNLHIPGAEVALRINEVPWKIFIRKKSRWRIPQKFFYEQRKEPAYVPMLFASLVVVTGMGIYANAPLPGQDESPFSKDDPQERCDPFAEWAPAPWEPAAIKIRFVDQTKSPLDFVPKGYKVNIGGKSRPINDWEEEFNVTPGQTVYLEKEGVPYSDPSLRASTPGATLHVSTSKIVYEINDEDLEDTGLSVPSEFGLQNQRGDAFLIPIDHPFPSSLTDTVLIPYDFASGNTEFSFLIAEDYEIRTEYCYLNQKAQNRFNPCKVRIAPNYED